MKDQEQLHPSESLHRVRTTCWPVVSRALQFPIFSIVISQSVKKILFISSCNVFHTILILCLVWFVDKQVLKTQNVLVFTLLSIGILTALTATTASQSLPVFAYKKCKHNGEKNCNDNQESQNVKAKNKCEIDNNNKDSIKRSCGFNDLISAKKPRTWRE